MWQEILTYIIVAGATVFLIRGIVQSFRGGEAGCGGNCACDAAKKPAANLGTKRQLVQIGIDRANSEA